MNPSRSTTETDLDRLDKFLSSDRSPEWAMQLSDLDGFLTSVAIGPELIMPSEWLPVIWGGDSPGFKNTKEAEEIIGAIMSRYNEILDQVLNDPETYEPIFWGRPSGIVIAMDWAEGFLDGVVLRQKAWGRLFADKKARSLMVPIAALWPEEAKQRFQITDAAEADWIEIAADHIPDAIVKIFRFWKSESKRV
jgi:uncharacterized protein